MDAEVRRLGHVQAPFLQITCKRVMWLLPVSAASEVVGSSFMNVWNRPYDSLPGRQANMPRLVHPGWRTRRGIAAENRETVSRDVDSTAGLRRRGRWQEFLSVMPLCDGRGVQIPIAAGRMECQYHLPPLEVN